MSLKPVDLYFEKLPEPAKSCMLAIRRWLIQLDPAISEEWKYRMPFYYYKGRMFCYLWTRKKTGQPYLGIVRGREFEHPGLIPEERRRMKILLIDPDSDLPLGNIEALLQKAMLLYC